MTFKGFDDYVEIFKGGIQTDSKGKEHDGDALIDKAVSMFNATEHEPPAVIGHPRENAPAWAWVEDVKDTVQDGTRVMLAKFKQVVPEFEEMVKKGLFKKRSASFYPDGRLRHVGFLGAVPPAVKGLADIGFKEEDLVTFEFEESWKMHGIGRIFQSLRDFLIEQFGLEATNKVISQWEIEDIKDTPEETFSDGAKSGGKTDMADFTQAQMDEAIEKAKTEEREKVNSEFAEKRREKRFSNDLAAVGEFCDRMVQDEKIAPAWIDGGLKTFMENQAGKDPVEFAEGTDKQTPLDWIMDFFENQLPKLVAFKEIAKREEDGEDVEPEFAECEDQDRLDLHKKIQALAKKEEITYSEAASRITE